MSLAPWKFKPSIREEVNWLVSQLMSHPGHLAGVSRYCWTYSQGSKGADIIRWLLLCVAAARQHYSSVADHVNELRASVVEKRLRRAEARVILRKEDHATMSFKFLTGRAV